jgi:hypothetical protein
MDRDIVVRGTREAGFTILDVSSHHDLDRSPS